MVFSEPAPLTASPVAADSSSEEEKVLQVLTSTESDNEITGVATALARSSLRISQSKLFVRAPRNPDGIGHSASSPTAKGGNFSSYPSNKTRFVFLG